MLRRGTIPTCSSSSSLTVCPRKAALTELGLEESDNSRDVINGIYQ